MGPPESPTGDPENQEGRPKRSARRLRTRRCLLKGCERRFHPHQVCQRYCGERCRKAARQWSRWKAQQRYRATTAGKQKRNGQSQRYREHVKSRKPPEPEAVIATIAPSRSTAMKISPGRAPKVSVPSDVSASLVSVESHLA